VFDLIAFMHLPWRIGLNLKGGFRAIASAQSKRESKAICKKPADYLLPLQL
jgi:hypothetical protein